jgi:hypothetical protein
MAVEVVSMRRIGLAISFPAEEFLVSEAMVWAIAVWRMSPLWRIATMTAAPELAVGMAEEVVEEAGLAVEEGVEAMVVVALPRLWLVEAILWWRDQLEMTPPVVPPPEELCESAGVSGKTQILKTPVPSMELIITMKP